MPGIDGLGLVYAVLGGFFMGSYPAFIKAPAVIELKVHPIIFQCYKSFWVFVFGMLILTVRSWGVQVQPGPTFAFTWWGAASGAAWIPAGLGTIACTPILGVALATCIGMGLSSLLSFFAFWLVFGEQMKEHAHGVYMAPVYLVFVLIGMVGMVASRKIPLPCTAKPEDEGDVEGGDVEEGPEEDCDGRTHTTVNVSRGGSGSPGPTDEAASEDDGAADVETRLLSVSKSMPRSGSPRSMPTSGGRSARSVVSQKTYNSDIVEAEERPSSPDTSMGLLAFGLLMASARGFFSSVQYGVITLGKNYETEQSGCRHCTDQCPDAVMEQFDEFGSWMASFGIGVAMITLIILLVWCMILMLKGRPMPNFHLRVMWKYGSGAGISYVLGALFQTAAIVQGGNATMMPANKSFQIIASGMWGIVWYREIRGWHAVIWGAFALLTVASLLMLGMEKVVHEDDCPLAPFAPGNVTGH